MLITAMAMVIKQHRGTLKITIMLKIVVTLGRQTAVVTMAAVTMATATMATVTRATVTTTT